MKNNNSNDQAKKELYAKLGITDEVIKNDDKYIAAQKEKNKEQEQQRDSSKDELDKEIGWKNYKELLLNMLFGFFMGISDGIPGYSGGTTLSIIGFYQKLVHHTKNIFKPEVKGTWWKYLLWFLPFLIVWIGFLILMMYIVSEVSKANQGVVLVFLFGSFAIFSIPFFILTNKDKLPNFVSQKGGFKKFNEEKGNTLNLVLMIVGFLVLLTVSLVVRFAFNGVSFLNRDENALIDTSGNTSVIFQYLLSGLLAGFFILVPGVSGGLMLYLTNVYPNVSRSIHDILLGEKAAVDTVPYLVVLLLGSILGIIISVIIVNWVSKKWEKPFYSLCLGFVAASFLSIFVSLSQADYATLSQDSKTLGLAIGMIPIAIVINVGIFIALNQCHLINFPKLYINFHKKEKPVEDSKVIN